MKIYYASSIRGSHSRESSAVNKKIIEHLKRYGTVLTEHIANDDIENIGEETLTDKEIHDRDWGWIESADVVIAEVSNPSLGVGYEIGRAVEHGKKILCLFKSGDKKLSAMIRGCSNIIVEDYEDIYEALKKIDEFIKINS
jgi:nucleoside 2-deoxyribosyltransferase